MLRGKEDVLLHRPRKITVSVFQCGIDVFLAGDVVADFQAFGVEVGVGLLDFLLVWLVGGGGGHGDVDAIL